MQPSAALEAEAARQEKQLLTAIAKIKELEAALSLLQTEKVAGLCTEHAACRHSAWTHWLTAQRTCLIQDLLGSESLGAAEKLAAAAKVEKELKHQLGKVKFVAKEMQDMHTALYEEKEAALAKVL